MQEWKSRNIGSQTAPRPPKHFLRIQQDQTLRGILITPVATTCSTVGIPRLIFEVATRKEPLCDWLETTESDGILEVQAGDRPHGTRMRLRQIQTA